MAGHRFFATDVPTFQRLLRENRHATLAYTGTFGQSRAVEALALGNIDLAAYVLENYHDSLRIETPRDPLMKEAAVIKAALLDAALERVIATHNVAALHLIISHAPLWSCFSTASPAAAVNGNPDDPSFPINTFLSRGNTVLHYAVQYEAVHATDYLLAQGANPAVVSTLVPKVRWAHGLMRLPREEKPLPRTSKPFQVTNKTIEALALNYIDRASNTAHHVQILGAGDTVTVKLAPGAVCHLVHRTTGQVVAYLDTSLYDAVAVFGPGHVIDETCGRYAGDTVAARSPLQLVSSTQFPDKTPMANIQKQLQLKDRIIGLLTTPVPVGVHDVAAMIPLVTCVEDLPFFVGVLAAASDRWTPQESHALLTDLLHHVIVNELVVCVTPAAFFHVRVLKPLQELGFLDDFQAQVWVNKSIQVMTATAPAVAALRHVIDATTNLLQGQISEMTATIQTLGHQVRKLLLREQVRAIRGGFKHKCNVVVGLATCHFGFAGKVAKEIIVRALVCLHKQYVTLPPLCHLPPQPPYAPPFSPFVAHPERAPLAPTPAYPVSFAHPPTYPSHTPPVYGRHQSTPPDETANSPYVERPRRYTVASPYQRHEPAQSVPLQRASYDGHPEPQPRPPLHSVGPSVSAATGHTPTVGGALGDTSHLTFHQLGASLESRTIPVTAESMRCLVEKLTSVYDLDFVVGLCLEDPTAADPWIRHAMATVQVKNLVVGYPELTHCQQLLHTCIQNNLVDHDVARTWIQWIDERRQTSAA